jgi:hypothetical protein
MNAPAVHRGDGSGRGVQLAFLPEPSFSPVWPSPSSLAGKALALLLTGRTLTHPEFEAITGSWRLSEPVRALRHDYGWPVDAIEITCPTDDRPDRTIAKYLLPSWVLKEVGAPHG